MLSRPTVTLVLLSLVSLACQPADTPPGSPAGTALRAEGERAAKQIQMTAVDGTVIDLAQLEGKVILIDVWATWCAPCRRALPGLGRLAASRPEHLAVIGLSVDQDRKMLDAFLAKQSLPYPVVHADEASSQTFPARVLPTMYVLDKTGEHVDTLVGELPEAALVTILSKYF